MTLPSVVKRWAPSARAMAISGIPRPCCVNGCQTGESAIDDLEILSTEMLVKRFNQSMRIQFTQHRQASQSLRLAEFHDGSFAVGHRLADKRHAEHRDAASLERFEREQRMIDGTQAGAGAEHNGPLPACEQIDLKRVPVERDEHAARPFDDQMTTRRHILRQRQIVEVYR